MKPSRGQHLACIVFLQFFSDQISKVWRTIAIDGKVARPYYRFLSSATVLLLGNVAKFEHPLKDIVTALTRLRRMTGWRVEIRRLHHSRQYGHFTQGQVPRLFAKIKARCLPHTKDTLRTSLTQINFVEIILQDCQF